MEEREESAEDRAARLERQVTRLERRNRLSRRDDRPALWIGLYLLVVSALTFFVVAWPLVVAFAIAAPLVWWRGVRRRRRLAVWRAERDAGEPRSEATEQAA